MQPQDEAAQQALDRSLKPLSQLILEACPKPRRIYKGLNRPSLWHLCFNTITHHLLRDALLAGFGIRDKPTHTTFCNTHILALNGCNTWVHAGHRQRLGPVHGRRAGPRTQHAAGAAHAGRCAGHRCHGRRGNARVCIAASQPRPDSSLRCQLGFQLNVDNPEPSRLSRATRPPAEGSSLPDVGIDFPRTCRRRGLLAYRQCDGRAQLTHMGAAVYASCMPSEQAVLLYTMLHTARKGRCTATVLLGASLCISRLMHRLFCAGTNHMRSSSCANGC